MAGAIAGGPYDDGYNPPYVRNEVYLPDGLTDGRLKLISASVTVTGGADLLRGALMGQITAQGVWVLSTTAATDGSQIPRAVLADAALCATNGGDQVCGVYLFGEFNASLMTFGTGWTPATAALAVPRGLFLKNTGV